MQICMDYGKIVILYKHIRRVKALFKQDKIYGPRSYYDFIGISHKGFYLKDLVDKYLARKISAITFWVVLVLKITLPYCIS
jgi:hypothetical protein